MQGSLSKGALNGHNKAVMYAIDRQQKREPSELMLHRCNDNPCELNRGRCMPISQEDKDEIRELIATEMRKAAQEAVDAILNAPAQLVRYPSAEEMQAREERNKLVREVGDAVVKAFEAIEQEAQARVVEKTDPARADRIRKMVLTF